MKTCWLAAVAVGLFCAQPLSAESRHALKQGTTVSMESPNNGVAPNIVFYTSTQTRTDSSTLFSSDWKTASPAEKAAFLEANPEIRSKVEEKWEKSSPRQRKDLLKKHPLLSNRPLQHSWTEATPEERVAFLEMTPGARGRIKETWEFLTPEQRQLAVQKRPSVSIRVLYHNWDQATGEEKMAFLESQADLNRELSQLWDLAAASGFRTLAEAPVEQRVQFLQESSQIVDMARNRWQKTTPFSRAQLARKWAGWKLQPPAGVHPGSDAKKKHFSKK